MPRSRILLVALALVGLVPAASPAAAPDKAALDSAFRSLADYDWGKNRADLQPIDDAIVASHGDAAARKALETRLAAVLATGASHAAKDFVCRKLYVVGTEVSVPALAPLLLDKDLSHMARYALERMPYAAAGKALRDALPRAAGKLKVGIVNSLGVRGDAEAAPALAPLLKDADREIVAASLAALGKIATPDAAAAVLAFKASAPTELHGAAVDACLDLAQGLLKQNKTAEAATIYKDLNVPTEPESVRLAAFQGLVATNPAEATPRLVQALAGENEQLRSLAVHLIREVPGEEATKAFAASFPKLPPAGQAALLEALAARNDPAARPAVVEGLKSASDPVRLAALGAMAAVGTADDVPMLAQIAASDKNPDADIARRALGSVRGENVNRVLLDAMKTADAPTRVELIRALTARFATEASATLLVAARDADPAVRAAALEALAALASEKDTPALVGLVKAARDDAEREAAEKALAALCGRGGPACADAVLAGLAGADAPSRAALLRALGRAGGPKALAAVRAALKDADAGVSDAAVRVLAEWKTPDAAADLLAIARTSASTTHQVLALRGYVRLAREQKGPDDQKTRMLSSAMAVAKRPDDKVMVLGALGDVATAESLALVMAHLGDAAVSEGAAAAAVRIAGRIADTNKDLVREAMEKVSRVAKDRKVKDEAEKILARVGPTMMKAPRILESPQEEPPARRPGAYDRLRQAAEDLAPEKPAAAKEPRKPAPRDDSAAEKLGWRLGLQAYTFRMLTFYETVDRAKELGIKYIEAWPGQRLSPEHPDLKMNPSLPPEARRKVKEKLAAAGVKVTCIGVTGASKEMFAFAKDMGIEVVVTETRPTPELDAMLKEYGLKMALHNHPRSWPPDQVLEASKGLSDRVGACADTGHWMRAGLQPVETLQKLQGRIISLHFKDLNEFGQGRDVPWGTGKGDARGMLAELKRQGFQGVFSIEYEHGSPEELMKDLAGCVEFFDKTAAELAAQEP